MKATSAQMYMAASTILSGILAHDCHGDIDNIEHYARKSAEAAQKLAEFIPDVTEAGADRTPSDEQVRTIVIQCMKVTNGRVQTKTQLMNTIRLKGIEQMVAEYMVSRAEGMGIINAQTNGTRTDYTLA